MRRVRCSSDGVQGRRAMGSVHPLGSMLDSTGTVVLQSGILVRVDDVLVAPIPNAGRRYDCARVDDLFHFAG